ncbi:MAG: polysaccharide biosynthesis/export family protein [Desulfobaccales bacterium]
MEAQAASATVTEPSLNTYLLGAEDTIEVSVWKEPDLTKTLVVRPDGKISYPLLGDLKAAGLTVKQLQAEIQKGLEKYVTDVHVTVILVKAQYYKIYVTGKVNKPGEFLVGQAPTVMRAIAMAGGLTPFASPSNIVILRKAGDREDVFYFNYNKVSQGESLEEDRLLLPGDVVVVP